MSADGRTFASTTAHVVEWSDLDPSTLLRLFRQDMENQGYVEYVSETEVDETIVGELAELVVMLRDIAPRDDPWLRPREADRHLRLVR